tara:strand:+ start:24050 stop:24829 length:780 start_codon:yes stop_codon:yes gene_type:complete
VNSISWLLASLIPFLALTDVQAQGNTEIESFSKAKRLLQQKVYNEHRQTLYCNAVFDEDKNVQLPQGFHTDKHKKRAARIEWEHVVPAENFGRFYSEWREGHPLCVSRKGKAYRGRKCAEKVVSQYRLMQADMHNLFPAIGAVNALRSNYSFTVMPQEPVDFGSCAMKIENRKAEPPEESRGRIARTYLYMAETYPQLQLSKKTQHLMQAWHQRYPVAEWECDRASAIETLQGNANLVVNEACSQRLQKGETQEQIANR